eukprot:CAMPEP_0201283492 /NCGR_PEP_ID=MMETSP1317-20130820/8697_1 /ASSEMBLY_ACC=CAM_ASM_000770 /TAXON_ID=187299 /ORGANISM="Undescribed Undescribed, Strain Undescribed" /LENGTH=41 /DNA_ID= /DNA_START= /DNA_END= /DNA_ORIENTATION=
MAGLPHSVQAAVNLGYPLEMVVEAMSVVGDDLKAIVNLLEF